MARRVTRSEAEQKQYELDRKKQDVTAALGESGTNFLALANLILNENRRYAAEDAAGAVSLRFLATLPATSPTRPRLHWERNWSPEEISGLADFCATQSNTFNREEWFAYLGNAKKIFVVNFGLRLPVSNEAGTVINRGNEESDVLENGTDFLVQAETPEHANELFTELLEQYQLIQTTIADADVTVEFNNRKAEIESYSLADKA